MRWTRGRSSSAGQRYTTDMGSWRSGPAWKRAIRCISSPLIVAGFGADFDGDAMQYHVPATDEAVKDAYEKMMPSRNLLAAASYFRVINCRARNTLVVYTRHRPCGLTAGRGSSPPRQTPWPPTGGATSTWTSPSRS